MTKNSSRKVTYEIKMVEKTVNFLKKIIKKTYRITKVISKCGVVQKVTIGFLTFVFALELRFGNLKPIEPIIQPQTQLERLQHSRSPSVSNIIKLLS